MPLTLAKQEKPLREEIPTERWTGESDESAMNDVEPSERQRVGLCAVCVHARRVESARKSVFFLCRRSADDPNYPKYPRLPVIACPGYEPRAS